MIQPWWPLVLLAAVEVVDAALCWRPVRFVRDNLRRIRFPRRYWWVLTPVKVVAAAGLTIGIWIPPLALLTSGALVLYFLAAVVVHLRVRDFGRGLFLNAIGMLAICAAVLAVVVVRIGD